MREIHHLTLQDRQAIQFVLNMFQNRTAIAELVGRHAAISLEPGHKIRRMLKPTSAAISYMFLFVESSNSFESSMRFIEIYSLKPMPVNSLNNRLQV